MKGCASDVGILVLEEDEVWATETMRTGTGRSKEKEKKMPRRTIEVEELEPEPSEEDLEKIEEDIEDVLSEQEENREEDDNADGESEELPQEKRSADTSSLAYYLYDVRKERLLSAEEEIVLARKKEAGDRASRERLIVCNLRLVVKIAKRYMWRGMMFEDLVEEGNIGLIKGIDRFRVARGCRISTYVTWWIRQAIERGLKERHRTIKVPVNIEDFLNRRRRIVERLTDVLEYVPTIEDITEEMLQENLLKGVGKSGKQASEQEIEKERVRLYERLCNAEVLEVRLNTLSIDHSPEGSDGESGASLARTIKDEGPSPEEIVFMLEMKDGILKPALAILNENERMVIRRRFAEEPETLGVIGQDMDLTRERIRQIEAQAIKKMRMHITRIEAMKERKMEQEGAR